MRTHRLPRARLLPLLLAVILLLTGCWDRREIEDMGFIMAMGLDSAPAGDGVEVTFQVAVPRAIIGSTGGGGMAGPGTPPVVVERIRAGTVYEAIRNLETQTNRRVSLVQLRLIIFGKDLAKSGLMGHIGLLHRHREMRQTIQLMVAENKAAEILQLHPAMERDPSLFLEDLTRRARERTAWAPRINLYQFLKAYETLAVKPVLPIVHPRRTEPGLDGTPPDTKSMLRGTAIFQRDRMVCELQPEETEKFLMLTGQVRSFVEQVPVSGQVGPELVMELTTESTAVSLDVSGKEPSFTIAVKTEGEIKETMNLPPGAVTPAGIARLGAAAGGHLEQDAQRLVERLQSECNADILGLGRQLQMRFADQPSWERYNWPDHFPRAKVKVEVTTYVRRTGMSVQAVTPK